MLKQADIIGEFVSAGRNSRKDIEHSGIYFAGISLSGYRIAGLKSHLLRDHRINLVNGLLIPIE